MGFISDEKIDKIKKSLASDPSELGKLYKSKKSKYTYLSIEHSLVKDYEKDDWEVDKSYKTKTKIKKIKNHAKQFEDDVWCQFYNLGYRTLNRDETFILPFDKSDEDTKQIDVIAINEETIFLIECKSSFTPKKAPSYKDEFELLRLRIGGFRKTIHQLFGKDKKIKYIFATRNLRLDAESEDIKRLNRTKAFYYNDNTYEYINNLIKNYKDASLYQFLGLIFKNEKINDNKIEIPAVEGKMGKKTYYMFSIEPDLLLKLGFILHRTKANVSEMPTYQRLLVPSRIKGITKFIEDGGYFPNSLIINFRENKKVDFEAISNRKSENSSSRIGILKIPNEYAIAYIIDGQHRLYGYANSKFKNTNTIPVVALYGLESTEQLGIFMDINQNQKAVSPNLRLVLEEDLYWDSKRLDYRLKALRSSIIRELAIGAGPLYNKISIGEDGGTLTSKPFATALLNCSLLPKAKGNNYVVETIDTSLYDEYNLDYHKAMLKSKKDIVSLLNKSYEFVEEEYADFYNNGKFIVSNRGTYAFIMLIGSLHKYLFNKTIKKQTSIQERFIEIKKYLIALLDGLSKLSKEEAEKYLIVRGAGADIIWFRFFQSLVNKKFSEYEPTDLLDWKERQNEELQDKGRRYGEDIEKYIKKTILIKLKELYGDKWDLEIGSIKRDCVDRALKEDEKNHKEKLDKEKTEWTEMFNINDYKAIIEKHWTKKLDNNIKFKSFEEEFSIDMGFGFNSKAEKIKWMSHFNSYRNLWAHAGTKEKRLNKEEVDFLQKIYQYFYKNISI